METIVPSGELRSHRWEENTTSEHKGGERGGGGGRGGWKWDGEEEEDCRDVEGSDGSGEGGKVERSHAQDNVNPGGWSVKVCETMMNIPFFCSLPTNEGNICVISC